MGSVIVVTSGKGGTGKTSLCAGLGFALCELGYTVLCIDADVGLRNLDIALGMTDSVLMDFADVIEGHTTLHRAAALHPNEAKLSLLTAPLLLEQDESTEEGFRMLLSQARAQYDYILIDSPAGLGLGFHLASCAADEAIVLATDDLSALRDAQRVVAQLGARIPVIRLVVNRVRPKLLARLGLTVDDLMDNVGLPLLGLVPEDARVLLSANAGKPLLRGNTKGAAQAYRNIAKRLLGQAVPLMKIGRRGLIV